MRLDMRPKTWSIEYQVRKDAESMFVPVELLPNASRATSSRSRRCSQPSLGAVELPVVPWPIPVATSSR